MVGNGRLQFSVLGSGSGGNSVLVVAGETRVLVDAGLNLKETRARMTALGLPTESVDGVLVTHEHSDHVAQAGVLARGLSAPVWIDPRTKAASPDIFRGAEELFDIPDEFSVGGLRVRAVAKRHDAAAPVAFFLTYGADTLGVISDLGQVDEAVGEAIGACTSLFIESNHDPSMLAAGPYPMALKRRVGGGLGHLSNEDSAKAVAQYGSSRLRLLVLGHLSRQNNHPDCVRAAFRRHLGVAGSFPRWISYQNRATPLYEADGSVAVRPHRVATTA